MIPFYRGLQAEDSGQDTAAAIITAATQDPTGITTMPTGGGNLSDSNRILEVIHSQKKTIPHTTKICFFQTAEQIDFFISRSCL